MHTGILQYESNSPSPNPIRHFRVKITFVQIQIAFSQIQFAIFESKSSLSESKPPFLKFTFLESNSPFSRPTRICRCELFYPLLISILNLPLLKHLNINLKLIYKAQVATIILLQISW